MGLNQYLTPKQAEMLTGVPERTVRSWAESQRIRSATKRLFSHGHLVVRTIDVIEAACREGHLRLADVLEPLLWPEPCEMCGIRPSTSDLGLN